MSLKFRILYVLLGLLLPSACFSQNAVTLLRPRNLSTSAIIVRKINVPMILGAQAVRVARLDKNNFYEISIDKFRVNVEIQREITFKSLRNPIGVYGPYKYLKTVSKASQNPLLVNDKYIDNWKHIHTLGYYQGAHHLINKSTIKMIYKDLKEQGYDVHLNEMEANAPAIFHPLHGDQDFREVFHNSEQQYYDYKLFGMKVVVISLLERIDEIGMAHGLKPYSQEYLEGVLKEAQLWCIYYNIKWE